jgi:ATP-dependent DNA ligase
VKLILHKTIDASGIPVLRGLTASLRLHRKPCQLSTVAARPPSGSVWVHELEHDGYRLMVRRDGLRVRCFTRNGYDWAMRLPAIVDAALRVKAQSFLIDGEAVIISAGRRTRVARAAVACLSGEQGISQL